MNIKMVAKQTREEYIIKAIKVHGDAYDYRKTVYESYKTDLTITCKNHGDFQQRPYVHLKGSGCPRCSKVHKVNTEDFIKRSNEIHDNFYNYTKTVYKNAKTKVTITCPEHGDFQQIPHVHLTGAGCDKCAMVIRKLKRRTDPDKFIEQAKAIHGNTYDYSKTKYINSTTNVIIICKIHNEEFEQRPSVHLTGAGCKKCGNDKTRKKRSFTTEYFKEKANEIHDNFYDYTKTVYKNAKTKVTITCPDHGDFEQDAWKHMNGNDCQKCAKVYKINTEEFMEKANEIHDNFYDYSKVVYKNAKTKIVIICPDHGDFEQIPYSHLIGKGCQKCKQSRGEKKVNDILKKFGIENVSQQTFENCVYKDKLKFDFYLKDHHLLIEFDGIQHFESVDFFGGEEGFLDTQIRDNIKDEFCKENNIPLLRIRFDDKNIEKIILGFILFSKKTDLK